MKLIVAAFALAIAAPAMAQNVDPAPTYAAVIAMDVPVVAGDITDRPYRVLGVIETNVRKATAFSRDPSISKVYRELWERAERLGADAVVNAGGGDPRITFWSWGARRATGQAIKFLTDEEIAALNGNVAVAEAPASAVPAGIQDQPTTGVETISSPLQTSSAQPR